MTSPGSNRLRADEALVRFAHTHDISRGDLPSVATLAKLRCIGGGPPFVKPKPSVVLYEWPAFEQWLLARMTPKASTAADAAARRQTAGA